MSELNHENNDNAAMRGIVKLQDGRLASFQVRGSGIPALMIPGAPGIGASYLAGDADLFPTVLHAYLVDPPGSGQSTSPHGSAGYSPGALARFYEEVRKALRLPRVVVLGHSLGAAAALAYAAMYPHRTIACIAAAPVSAGSDPGNAGALLSSIRRPVLVVAGDLDFVSRPAEARRLARRVPRAQHSVLPGCGHLPALEAPDAYREVVLDFLRYAHEQATDPLHGCMRHIRAVVGHAGQPGGPRP